VPAFGIPTLHWSRVAGVTDDLGPKTED
jgi:hypothetical protein